MTNKTKKTRRNTDKTRARMKQRQNRMSFDGMQITITKSKAIAVLQDQLDLLKHTNNKDGQLELNERILRKLETMSLRQLFLDEIEYLNGCFVNTSVLRMQVFVNDNEYILYTNETEEELRKKDELIVIESIYFRIMSVDIIKEIIDTSVVENCNEVLFNAELLYKLFHMCMYELKKDGFDTENAYYLTIKTISFTISNIYFNGGFREKLFNTMRQILIAVFEAKEKESS